MPRGVIGGNPDQKYADMYRQADMSDITRQTFILHVKKQRHRSATRYCAADKHLFFIDYKAQFIYLLNPIYLASSHLLWLYSLVCVYLVRYPKDSFSHDTAHIILCSPNDIVVHMHNVFSGYIPYSL